MKIWKFWNLDECYNFENRNFCCYALLTFLNFFYFKMLKAKWLAKVDMEGKLLHLPVISPSLWIMLFFLPLLMRTLQKVTNCKLYLSVSAGVVYIERKNSGIHAYKICELAVKIDIFWMHDGDSWPTYPVKNTWLQAFER